MKLLSHVQLFATPCTIACQAPPSMGFSRQEYWSVLPFPSPGGLPDPGIESGSPTLQTDSLPSEPSGKPIQCQVNSNTAELSVCVQNRAMSILWNNYLLLGHSKDWLDRLLLEKLVSSQPLGRLESALFFLLYWVPSIQGALPKSEQPIMAAMGSSAFSNGHDPIM